MKNQRGYQHDVIGSIVAYQSAPAEIEQAIHSFMSARLRVRMLVIDNSPRETLGPLCRRLGAEYLFTGTNHGFGAGHNIALRNTTTGKYHLALNPDVQFEPQTLEELVEFLDLNESVGLVMPRVIYPDGSPQRLCKRLPAPFDILARRTFPGRLKRLCHSRMSWFELANINTETVLSVPHLSGCFMLMRKKALLECGFFDERFFLYFEDIDLTRRLHERYQTVYYPHVRIMHRHEKGSYKSLRLFLYGMQSAIRYFNKWGWVWDQGRDLANSVIGPLSDVSLPHRLQVERSTLVAPGACFDA
jgi:GT2 family glycosyltransferase